MLKKCIIDIHQFNNDYYILFVVLFNYIYYDSLQILYYIH